MYVDIDFTRKSWFFLKIRSRHSKDRQYNGQKKKDKKNNNNDLQNPAQKSKFEQNEPH
jgi:hypothetical protein